MQRYGNVILHSPHVSPHSAKTLADTDTGLSFVNFKPLSVLNWIDSHVATKKRHNDYRPLSIALLSQYNAANKVCSRFALASTTSAFFFHRHCCTSIFRIQKNGANFAIVKSQNERCKTRSKYCCCDRPPNQAYSKSRLQPGDEEKRCTTATKYAAARDG